MLDSVGKEHRGAVNDSISPSSIDYQSMNKVGIANLSDTTMPGGSHYMTTMSNPMLNSTDNPARKQMQNGGTGEAFERNNQSSMMEMEDEDAMTFQVVRKVGQDKKSTYILEEQQYLIKRDGT